MKRLLFSLLAMLVAFVLVSPVQATLINRGTDTAGNRLIYDPDLDITWYDFSNTADTWDNQVAWAGALSVDFGGDIIDDWRLPTTVDGAFIYETDPSFYNGTGPSGFNITSSEMGHLFYTELENIGWNDTSGNPIYEGTGMLNTGDFQNLTTYAWEHYYQPYWSGTENLATNTNSAWYFDFNSGRQHAYFKYDNFYGLAVRSGDVPDNIIAAVPEPTTIALLGIGLAGLAGVAVRRRLKKTRKEEA